MVNINIYSLTLCDCIGLKMPYDYDFMVVCSDGKWDWRGYCDRECLQECVEIGLAKYKGIGR